MCNDLVVRQLVDQLIGLEIKILYLRDRRRVQSTLLDPRILITSLDFHLNTIIFFERFGWLFLGFPAAVVKNLASSFVHSDATVNLGP